MSYSHNRFLTQTAYNSPNQSFVPWSQQLSQLLNLNHPLNSPFPPYPPSLSPMLHPNLLIQQQNNYYNSTVASPSGFMRQMPSQVLVPKPKRPFVWSPEAALPRISTTSPQKPSKNPEIIVIDEDSPTNVILIQDSPEEEVQPVVVKKDQKKQDQIQNKQIKLQAQKQIKEDTLLNDGSKVEAVVLGKRQNKPTKCAYQVFNNTNITQPKVIKKKSTPKDKHGYKFTAHEKHLAELSEYREFFPHQTVTGPQFQAKIPRLQSFNSKFDIITANSSWLQIRRQKLLQRLQTTHGK